MNYSLSTENLPEQGCEGTVLFKIFSYGLSKQEAIERCKMEAVYAIMFEGVANSNSEKPLIKNNKLLSEKRTYFTNFFGVDNITARTRNNGQIPFGKENAPYRNFVSIATNDNLNPNDILRSGQLYRIGVPVSVKLHKLRKKLEEDKIIEKFGIH
jgi:hypothetical protein